LSLTVGLFLAARGRRPLLRVAAGAALASMLLLHWGLSTNTNSLFFVFLAFLFLLQGDSGMRTLHVVSFPSVFCVPLIWTWGVLGLSLFWHFFFVVVLVLCFPVCLAMLSQFRAYICCFAPYVLTHFFLGFELFCWLHASRCFHHWTNGKRQDICKLISLSLFPYFDWYSIVFVSTDKTKDQNIAACADTKGNKSTHSTTREKASRLFFCRSCVQRIVSPSLLPVCLSPFSSLL